MALDRDNLASEVRNELERLINEGRVSARVYNGTVEGSGRSAIRSVRSNSDVGTTQENAGRLSRLGGIPSGSEVEPNAQRREQPATRNGIGRGLPAEQTDATRRLAERLNRWLAGSGRVGEQVRFREVAASSLPDATSAGLRALAEATGTNIVIIRNLTPDVERFNGLTFGDGTLYIDESADMPVTLVATHEWVHQLPHGGQKRHVAAKFDAFVADWSKKDRAAARVWRKARQIVALKFPHLAEIYKVTCTSRAINSINRTIRKYTRKGQIFSNHEPAVRSAPPAIREVSKGWLGVHHWETALKVFPSRFSEQRLRVKR